jgi:ankyrin repeat protein
MALSPLRCATVALATWAFLPAGIPQAAGAAVDAPVADAAQRNNPDAVIALLDTGGNPNESQPDGATPLHWAVHWEAADLVERLILDGAEVDAVNDLGVSALAIACRNGSTPMVDLLVDAAASVFITEPSGETALMTCARTGTVGAVGRLLDAGADVDAREQASGQTALMWAASGGHADVVRALLASGPGSGVEVDARSGGAFTPLLFAARAGSLETTRQLIDAGADVNVTTEAGYSPLLVAAASVDAITGSDYRLVEAPSEHEAVGGLLLEHGADANQADQYGMTPLHFAVEMRKPGLLRALLAHGADPDRQLTGGLPFRRGDYVGRGAYDEATPFWLAARLGDVPTMRVLLEAGANPHLPAARGVTPLLVASGLTQSDSRMVAESELLKAVRMLVLEVGVDVREVASNGQTAVHGAAGVSGNDLIRFLVEQGADPLAEDGRGSTPHDVAIRTLRPRPVTAALLLQLAGHTGAP